MQIRNINILGQSKIKELNYIDNRTTCVEHNGGLYHNCFSCSFTTLRWLRKEDGRSVGNEEGYGVFAIF